jgi:hypothetical protein
VKAHKGPRTLAKEFAIGSLLRGNCAEFMKRPVEEGWIGVLHPLSPTFSTGCRPTTPKMMEIPEEMQEAADAADAVQGTLLGQLALPLSRITLNK